MGVPYESGAGRVFHSLPVADWWKVQKAPTTYNNLIILISEGPGRKCKQNWLDKVWRYNVSLSSIIFSRYRSFLRSNLFVRFSN